MDKTYQDGWQVIPVSQVFDSIRLSVTAGKEQDRLVDIMTDLLGGQTYVKWFFSEEHSDDKNVDAEKIREELQNLKIYVVFNQFHRCVASCKQSEDGCLSGARALSEYFMFEV